MVNDLQFQFSKSAGGSSKPFSFCCLFFVVCKAATSYASSYKTRDSHLPSCHLAQYRPVFFLFFFSVIFFPVSAANFVLRWTEKKVKKKKNTPASVSSYFSTSFFFPRIMDCILRHQTQFFIFSGMSHAVIPVNSTGSPFWISTTKKKRICRTRKT